MPNIKLVVFDIAGTIIEDRGEVITAFGSALQNSGIPFTVDELKEWKGASKLEVIRHFVERENSRKLSADEVERIYKLFRSELEDLYRGRIHPIPGAAATLAWCRERGIQLATTTGFCPEISDLVLDGTGWRYLFAANVTSSDVKRGRPAPFMIFHAMERAGIEDVRQVVNVGDTPLDLQAGTNAGVLGVVGVLTGSHGEDRLQREPHTHLLPSVAELPSLIEHAF
ncbi:MAG TPA: HAD hydrolase-like protein [Terriglobales bacterium]|nr:HAD hydrolase-like protein [Terriglobales bacterium]